VGEGRVIGLTNDIGRVPPRRPVILLDVDGVLADFIGANLRTLSRAGLHGYRREDVTQWDCAAAWGLSDATKTIMKRAWSAPGFCQCIEPYPEAEGMVDRLREIGDVYAVTAPMSSNPTWMHERREWLVDYFGFKGDADIVQTAAKHLVRGDVFVEDKASTLHSWQLAWPESTGVLWSRPYNEIESWGGPRTESWQFLVDLVSGKAASMALDADRTRR
jgi:5'-nucleotidase